MLSASLRVLCAISVSGADEPYANACCAVSCVLAWLRERTRTAMLRTAAPGPAIVTGVFSIFFVKQRWHILGTGAHWSRCRLISSDRGPGEPPSTGVWYRDSSPRLKLARAGRRHANLGPMRALGEGAESVVEGAVEGSARIWSAGTGTFEH